MHTRRSKPKHTRGFTLIEATIAVAVTGVLLTIAVPSLQRQIDTRRIDGIAKEMSADLQFARSEAVARNEPVRFSVHADATGSSCYVIHTGLAAQCSCSIPGPATCSGNAQQIKTVALSATQRVSIEANVSSLLFDPLHGTSTPSGTLKITGADTRAVHHVVNIMGRIRSCSPQASVSGWRAC